MKQRLQELYNKHHNTFAQALLSFANADLYEWFIKETAYITDADSIKGKAHIYLNNIDLSCPNGNTKKWSQGKIRFCGKPNTCECFRQFTSDSVKETTVFNTSDFKETQKERWKESGNPLTLQKNKDKREQAFKDRTDNRKLEIKKQYQDYGYEQVVERLEKENLKPAFTREEYNGSFRKNEYNWNCTVCESNVAGHVDYGTVPRCLICHPRTTSTFEKEIAQYIESLGFNDLVYRSKSFIPPQELDIYIPSKQIAVECNGVYWHSSIKKSKTYHVDKFLKCAEQGIHLIQIFENEWHTKQEIVKDRLAALLGKGIRIYARKTTVKEIENSIAKDFIDKHHLRGYASAKTSYGLYHNNELVAVMTFGKGRYKKYDCIELIKFCSKGNIVGGASKLLNQYIKDYKPTSILSYADRCWSNGNLYKKLGFGDCTEDIRNTGYWYVNGFKRIHRSNLTKSKLIKMGYDASLTEEEIVTNHLKYLKIYDCGNFIFRLDIK